MISGYGIVAGGIIMTRPIASLVAVSAAAIVLAASVAQAQTSQNRRQANAQTWSSSDSGSSTPHIILGGRDMGTDPDPRIRAYMGRDSGMAFGGNY
jgi:hypothetical protein